MGKDAELECDMLMIKDSISFPQLVHSWLQVNNAEQAISPWMLFRSGPVGTLNCTEDSTFK